MEYAEFECFEKYSTFAKWCKKCFLTDKDKLSDEYFTGLVRHLEETNSLDVLVFKLNAFWDASPAVQELLVKDAKHLIKVLTKLIKNFLIIDQSTFDPQAATSAVKLITYIYNRASKAINETENDKKVLEELTADRFSKVSCGNCFACRISHCDNCSIEFNKR